MTEFTRVEPDTRDFAEMGLCGIQCRERVLFGQMSEEAKNESMGDTEPAFALCESVDDAVDDVGERNAASGVTLWIEEHFDMDDAIGVCTLQIGKRQVVKVASRA